MTITEAAEDISKSYRYVSRQWLSTLANGRQGGREAADLIERWSGGWVSKADIMLPSEHKYEQMSCQCHVLR